MAKKPKTERKISVLNPNKVEYFIKNTKTGTITSKPFGNLALTKRIIGHALDRIRKHGVSLIKWDCIEIDLDPPNPETNTVKMDVHFINEGKITHGLLGLELDPVSEKISTFEVIAVQPKF